MRFKELDQDEKKVGGRSGRGGGGVGGGGMGQREEVWGLQGTSNPPQLQDVP